MVGPDTKIQRASSEISSPAYTNPGVKFLESTLARSVSGHLSSLAYTMSSKTDGSESDISFLISANAGKIRDSPSTQCDACVETDLSYGCSNDLALVGGELYHASKVSVEVQTLGTQAVPPYLASSSKSPQSRPRSRAARTIRLARNSKLAFDGFMETPAETVSQLLYEYVASRINPVYRVQCCMLHSNLDYLRHHIKLYLQANKPCKNFTGDQMWQCRRCCTLQLKDEDFLCDLCLGEDVGEYEEPGTSGLSSGDMGEK